MNNTRNLVVEIFGRHAGHMEIINILHVRAMDRVRALTPLDDFQIERARARCERLPKSTELAAWRATLEAALQPTCVDGAWLRLAVGLMLDGLPAAKVDNLPVFIDAICFTLQSRRVNAPLIVSAARRLWERRRRAPSISLLIEELLAAEADIQEALELIKKCQRLRDNAEQIVNRQDLLRYSNPLQLADGGQNAK